MNNLRLTPATVWRIAVPYFRSEDKLAGRLLLASVIAIELTVVGINVLLNQRHLPHPLPGEGTSAIPAR